MRRHVVLTHLSWPAKRFVYATGQEVLGLAGAALVALTVWRRLLPCCTSTEGPVTPLVVWARTRLASEVADVVVQYGGWLPFVAAALIVALAALVVLWEPEGRKLHRWAAVYAHTWLRVPAVAIYQAPVSRRPPTSRKETT